MPVTVRGDLLTVVDTTISEERMTRSKLTALALGAAFMLGTAAAPVAVSAQQAPPTQPPGGAPPAQSFSETELRAYADATVRLQEINEDYVKRLEDAPDADAEQQIRQKGQREMAEAVQDSGLTVERFSEISRTVREDPEVRGQVEGYIQEKQ